DDAAASWAKKASKADVPQIEGNSGEMDYSSCTRQQCHVSEGMLPTLSQEIRDKWKELCDKEGVKGTQQLKNALRNSVVKKDCTCELCADNLKDCKAEQFLKVTQSKADTKKEALQRAKDSGAIWMEEDSDGEELWYEKKKIHTSTHRIDTGCDFKRDLKPQSVEQYKQMITDSVTKNKAWLRKALCDTKKALGSGASSSKGESTDVDCHMMKTMQDAWDASTALTADAGLLAQRIKRDHAKSKINRERADEVMQLLKDCGPPSAELLSALGQPMEKLNAKKCRANLEACARIFLALEKAHQMLIESSGLAKKDKKKALEKARAISNK
ncbi:unnamed protein product, partial [Prorocentrum cordatum]